MIPSPYWRGIPKWLLDIAGEVFDDITCGGKCTNMCSCKDSLCVWDNTSSISCDECHEACTPGYVCEASLVSFQKECVQDGDLGKLLYEGTNLLEGYSLTSPPVATYSNCSYSCKNFFSCVDAKCVATEKGVPLEHCNQLCK
jgi:hypothetical protein